MLIPSAVRHNRHASARLRGPAPTSIAAVRILTRGDTQGAIALADCIAAVERAFRLHGEGRSLAARRLHVPAVGGGAFHVTAGGLAPDGRGATFGVKINGRFPPPQPGGSQRLNGAVLLFDAADGRPLALLDSMVVTGIRTAAVTALVVRLLARADARRALLVGAGRQAHGQVEALAATGLVAELAVYDLVRERAEGVAGEARSLGIEAEVVGDPGAAAATSDVVVTVTPATAPILSAADIGPGRLVVALGADGPGKQELDPAILAQSKVVVDVLEQAAEQGELQHALALGLIGREDVHAKLGELVAGLVAGRTNAEETFVFDATGTAIQDVAAASLLLDVARERGLGIELDLGA